MPRKLLLSGYLLILGVLLAACDTASTSDLPTATVAIAPTPVPADRVRSVVIDTDVAADDWMAILYLLQRPDVDVKAITVTGTGEAHCDPGIKHALGLV